LKQDNDDLMQPIKRSADALNQGAKGGEKCHTMSSKKGSLAKGYSRPINLQDFLKFDPLSDHIDRGRPIWLNKLSRASSMALADKEVTISNLTALDARQTAITPQVLLPLRNNIGPKQSMAIFSKHRWKV